jgi:predicted esterase
MILVHGRGATAESILDLANFLRHERLAYLAPQASGNTWYPLSFLSPTEMNEPYLSSALQRLRECVAEVAKAGMPTESTFIAGFSQGACLSAEYVARNPHKYGGVFLFSGGLIGPEGSLSGYSGSLAGTPVFMGCSDVDPHIPLTRVEETARILRSIGGQVDTRIYPGMGHTINRDELDAAQDILTRALEDRSG